MLRRLVQLLIIRNRFEAYAVIYALALGATARGLQYVNDYPGPGGYLLFAVCTLVVFMAGAKILDGTPARWRGKERRRGARRDRRATAG